MLIGFDLDGAVIDADNSVLHLLHKADRALEIGARAVLQRYYTSRPVKMDPRLYLASDDQAVFITGRVPSSWDWTHQWLRRHFPDIRCLFVADEQQEYYYAEGVYDIAARRGAALKLAAIKAEGVGIFFDNNPTIVRELRAAGVTAILVGAAAEEGVG